MPKGVRKRFLGTGTPHFHKLLRNFDFAEGKSQKNAYFWWFFEKFTQTTVISRKIALWSIFCLNLIFLILSYHLKQNLQEKTQKQKNGIWSKWRRNRPKSTKITPVHSQGRPRRGQVQFWSILPQLQEAAISSFLGHLYQKLFCLKAEHLNFHFPQKYWPWAHFWPSYGV